MTQGEKNYIVSRATMRMCALGTEASQRAILGKRSPENEALASSIFFLLKAYRKSSDLTSKQEESILEELRDLCQITDLLDQTSSSDQAVAADAVLYEDNSVLYYEDGAYVNYTT